MQGIARTKLLLRVAHRNKLVHQKKQRGREDVESVNSAKKMIVENVKTAKNEKLENSCAAIR